MQHPVLIRQAPAKWVCLALGCTSLVLGAFLLSACGSGEKESTASTVATHSIFPNSPDIQVPPGPPPKEVVTKDLEKGKGPVIPPITTSSAEVRITAIYKAVNYETKEIFEERWDPRHPYETDFDSGLDPAWEVGLPGMRVGGRRELIFPADMTRHKVPLVYVVELLRVEKIEDESEKGAEAQEAQATQAANRHRALQMSKKEIAQLPKLTIAKQSGPPPRHMKIVDLRKGTGAVVRPWHAVNVQFLQASYPEVEKRSRSGSGSGRQTYVLDGVVKGWTVGMPGMRVGGRRELILPPNLVYPRWKPSWGYKPYVTIYLIDLLGVELPTDPYGDRAILRRKTLGL